MSSALEYYIPNYSDTILPAVVGLLIAAATAFVIFGGVHRIGFISSVIVPIMAGIYILMGIFITLTNLDRVPEMFSLIFEGAFDFRAIFGGFAGSTVLIGIKRGLFSNEAGMGSAPNASATATVSHPVKQGMVQVLSVFIDTLMICTTTAFILLLSGVTGIPENWTVSHMYRLRSVQMSVHLVSILLHFPFCICIHKFNRKLLLRRIKHSVHQEQSHSAECIPNHMSDCDFSRCTG